MTEMTFSFVRPRAGSGFSFSPRHIPLCLIMFGFGCGLIRSSLTLSAPARRAREGVGLVSPMNLFSQSPCGCHLIISLAIPETGRVIAMSSLLQFYHCKSVVVWHVRCLFAFVYVSLSLLHGYKGSNGINWGQGRGSGNGFRIGLVPRTEGTGSFA
jgi:hypothetical protein